MFDSGIRETNVDPQTRAEHYVNVPHDLTARLASAHGIGPKRRRPIETDRSAVKCAAVRHPQPRQPQPRQPQPRHPPQPRQPQPLQPRHPHHQATCSVLTAGTSSRSKRRNEFSPTSNTSCSRRSIVRVRLVVGAVEASAGELSTQAAPASDKDTPITPRAFLPRCLFCGLSDERAIDSSQKISKTARMQTIALLARWSILIR